MKRDIRKLDDLDPSERLAAFLKMFPGSPDQPVRPGRSFLDILKGEDDDGDDDADLADHPIAELVRLLVAAGNKPDTARRSTIYVRRFCTARAHTRQQRMIQWTQFMQS